ncbi:MAG: crossover junction endodeoxyribonuclease RuvC [Spirobacillus cienkowskii]|uniref:Crossover junction endodeoxyribonuclease RuvC n=1 Tax=Spirobacillus cienkowskii TaxID=495820 RepID=A0A369KLT9_9BACT|nr:MAG: crossover junction endodeoxyribonuclease RuvC [Spirobacillus cienkowskii]
MLILGIDPGTRMAGYGLIEVSTVGKLKAIAAGAWQLNAKGELAQRLANLAIEFRRVVEAYHPSHLCLELSFLADNPRTALFLGHARGVILSEAYQSGLIISEISATSAKKIISGNGRADKLSIAKLMSAMLGFEFKDLPFDATDALAIAYADAMRMRDSSFQAATSKSNSHSMQSHILEEWQNKSRRKKSNVTFKTLLKQKAL